ncbi:Fc receptor-like protein 2 [Acipenser ruthenus]|uniref:Fc receptor-like protein 2 n=1 Tax=Acipenser ruthenus TaxID=7906 RepID=UPI0027407F22|nr:Fc receptor-like protein 2 [Acipenser ruthenus]
MFYGLRLDTQDLDMDSDPDDSLGLRRDTLDPDMDLDPDDSLGLRRDTLDLDMDSDPDDSLGLRLDTLDPDMDSDPDDSLGLRRDTLDPDMDSDPNDSLGLRLDTRDPDMDSASRIPLSRRSGNAVLPKWLTTLTGSGQSQELFSKPTLTFTPVSPVWEGEAVTLQCGAQINKQGTQLQYHYSKEGTDLRGAGSQDQHWIPAAGLRDTGRYQCEGEAAGTGLKKTSDPVSLTVRELPQPALTREPSGEIFEGDAVTLSCGVEGGSGGWKYLWYKDSESSPPMYQTDSSSGTGAGYTISAAALSHSGEYWCGAERNRTSLNSQYSHPIWVNVTALFSRVTLSASPGVTVKEGEALNLTCEAAVNKSPCPQLHYTIVRDGEPVTNSTDSALYSIASTEKSHTGNYTCDVESQGVRKSSQELHIEVQTSWHSAVAVGYRVSFFLIHLTVFTLLLLRYCRIRELPP